MKKMLALLLMFTMTFAQAVTFAPGQVLTAGALNTAFANAQITGGTIDGAIIGGTTPAAATHTALYLTTPDAFGYNATFSAYSAAGIPNAGLAFKSARGTVAAPTATQAGDILGGIDVYGYGTTTAYSASMDIVASGTFSGTSWPTKFVFNTTAVSAVAPATALTVESTGVSVTTGISAAGVYSSAYTDGTVVDYTSGNGRISVGAADTLSFYNGGISNTLLAQLTATGVKVPGGVTAAGQIYGAQVVNSVATVGAATLTAAQLTGGVIGRSGSTAAYTDTTDSAANIVAAIPNAQIGTSFRLRVLNTVAFVDTIAAGAGVTLTGTTAIAASTYRDFVGIITNVATPAVTLYGIGSGTL